jgi:protein subunit release factor A
MQYQLEIRAGEGGDDAKLFVTDLMNSYIKWFNKEN